VALIRDVGKRNDAQAVAFWRDTIPAGFTQRPGTKCRRTAGQIRADKSMVTIEPSFAVLGYARMAPVHSPSPISGRIRSRRGDTAGERAPGSAG
jgi:hypothetical protein